MTLMPLRHNLRYLLILLVLRLAGLVLVVCLIIAFDPKGLVAVPFSLSAIYLLFKTLHASKTLLLSSHRNKPVLTLLGAGMFVHSFPLLVKWRDIESVTIDAPGGIFSTIRLRLKDPDGFISRNGGWLLWLRFKLNSVFKCQLLFPSRAFDTNAHEFIEIINQQIANENTRQRELRRLQSTSVNEMMVYVKANTDRYGITLYEPASDEEIYFFEQSMNVTLPNDLAEFYRFCNGFESEEDWFRIIPLGEILEQCTTSNRKPGVFDFAEYMVYCDSWAVKISGGTYSIFEQSYDIVLTNSFSEFLERFLKGGVFETGGLYDWRDKMLKDPR